MKWFAVVFTLISTTALADRACEKQCDETSQMCTDQCTKALKKDHADKINFCKDKCKEFGNECKKECDPKKK